MATYAIGDIQGCFDELRTLLTKINFKSDRDQLWLCGDLVNRGPQSIETLRFVRDLGANAITVLGNHDLHLLATAYRNKKPGKKDTLDEIMMAKDREQLLGWLRQQPLIHHDKNLAITLVHAAIHPRWSLKKAIKLAREVEAVLQSDSHIEFYKTMYGDKPKNWDKTLQGYPRYRFITNVFTRLRYCELDGTMVLNAKSAPGKQPKRLFPWYEIPGRKTEQDVLIFGHWSTLPHAGREAINNTYPLDSGCVWGGRLTAMRIDDGSFEYVRLKCSQKQAPSLPKTSAA
jgi:bis(5'-nucleosyl)-tetraphosphatase (symmetrical)